MRWQLPLVGSLALVVAVGCDEHPMEPSTPQQSNSDLAAAWTTEPVTGLTLNVGVDVTEDGRRMRVVCSANNYEGRPAISRTRTMKDGERQSRLRSTITHYGFVIYDLDAGNVIVEQHDGPASGHMTVRQEKNFPPKWIADTKINGKTGGAVGQMSLKCETRYDAELSSEYVRRVSLGDRCWESPAGNTVLPCR